MVVRVQIAFKTIPTPENWKIESKEDHLTVIELSEIDGFTHNKLSSQVQTRKFPNFLGNKNVW